MSATAGWSIVRSLHERVIQQRWFHAVDRSRCAWRYADVLKDVGLLRLANHEEQSKRFFTMFYEGMMNDTQREEASRLESTPFVDGDRQLLLDDLFETCKEYNSYHGSGGVPLPWPTFGNVRGMGFSILNKHQHWTLKSLMHEPSLVEMKKGFGERNRVQ